MTSEAISRGRWCYDFDMIVFDELARILAAPMRRRNALKLAGKVLTGGVLASLAVGPSHATGKDSTSAKTGNGSSLDAHRARRVFQTAGRFYASRDRSISQDHD